jgi:hypothetical protein
MYVLDFSIEGEDGAVAIRTAWIIETSRNFPRLVTCYVRKTT